MFVQWNRTLNIGIPKVDREHRHLVAILNAFHRVHQAGAGPDKVFTALNLLMRYADVHFRDEEALMEAGRYPRLAEHRREHEALTRKIFDLHARCRRGEAEVTDETMEFLKRWLLDHILGMDKEIERYFLCRGIPRGWET